MERREGAITENVRVRGSHCGLGHNSMALFVIGDRLAQPEGYWHRFEQTGLKRLLQTQPNPMSAAEGIA
jgi:hypothetical protein